MCAVAIKIILLSLFLYKGACDQSDNNVNVCKNLCTSCGGVASYVDDQCECYIDDENQKNAECVGRIKRQAEDLHLDFVNCKPATVERPPLCSHRRNPGRLGMNDIDLIARYFMNGGPSNGIPILRSRCDNSGQQFQSTTPVKQLLDDFTNEPLDYYDLSTPSNQIEDPYYEPEQPGTVKSPCIPLSYVNRPTLSSTPLYPYVYKCTKYSYPSQSSSPLPIHSSFAAASSMYYPYNQFQNDFRKSTHLSSSQASCNPHHSYIPYAFKNFQPQPARNTFMDAISKSIAEQNIRKSCTNSQSWTDKINSVVHNSLFGGSSGSLIPQYPYNYAPGPYPIESSIPLDMIQLQTFLAQQNSFLESLNQFFQSHYDRSRLVTPSPYIVGAANSNIVGASTPISTENTNSWSIESSTPETYQTVTKTSDSKIQEENVSKVVSNTEIKGVNVGNAGLSDERSHRLIPMINRRMKRVSEIEKLKATF